VKLKMSDHGRCYLQEHWCSYNSNPTHPVDKDGQKGCCHWCEAHCDSSS